MAVMEMGQPPPVVIIDLCGCTVAAACRVFCLIVLYDISQKTLG